MIANCFACVASRSSLNVIDRYLFGQNSINFKFLYFSSLLLPFIYSLLLLPFFGTFAGVIEHILCIKCFTWALATNLVGLSFSYAFRHKDVRHVVLHTKIPELILPVFVFFSFFPDQFSGGVNWKHLVPLALTWVSFIPYFMGGLHKTILFDKPALCLFGSLLIQMLVGSSILISLNGIEEILVFTIAFLFWRCILSLPLSLKKIKDEKIDLRALSLPIILIIIGRGVIGLIAQFTLNLALVDGHPMMIWPLLNTSVILSAIASQYFLKEQIHKSDWIALSGLFLSSSLLQII